MLRSSIVTALLFAASCPRGLPAADCNGNGVDDAADVAPGRTAFSQPDHYTAGVFPAYIAAADLDGDGRLDLATLDTVFPSVSVLSNQGDGAFGAPADYPAEGHPIGLVAADFDGDDRPEMATVDGLTQVLIFRNRGDGSFAPRAGHAAGPNAPIGIRAADLDGDGGVDVLTPHWSFGMHIFWNEGGSFPGAPSRLPVANYPRSLAPGDLDGDGDLDVVVAAHGDGFFVLSNLGARSFASPALVWADRGALTAAIGDLDGDGRADLVLGSTQGLYLMARGADGVFEDPRRLEGDGWPTSIAIAELTGDGAPDIVSGSAALGIALYRNLGGGRFEALPPRGPGASSVVVGDFNDDGALDVAEAAAGQGVFIFPNPGDGVLPAPVNTLTRSVPWASALAAADFDGDRDLDFAMGSTEDVLLLVNRGDGLPESQVSLPQGFPSASVAAADLNGDGFQDLAGGADVLWARFGGPQSLLGPMVTLASDVFSGYVMAADVDRDGDPDLVTTFLDDAASEDDSTFQSAVKVLLNAGDGSFGEPRVLPTDDIAVRLLVADLDGRGDLDVVTWNGESDSISVTLNESGAFRRFLTLDAGGVLTEIAAADLDGDRRLDLVAGARSAGSGAPRLVFLHNRGGGAMDPGAVLLENGGVNSLSTADMDGDGDLDVVTDTADARIAVLVNWGDATFAPPLYFHAGNSPLVIPADLDGDGTADLACFNRFQPSLSIIPKPVVPPASKDLNRNGVPDECEEMPFHRGDPNDDGRNDLSDAIALFEYLFLGGATPSCLESADANNDGAIDLSDGVSLLSHLFLGGPPPASPGPAGEPCGLDPDPPGSARHLGCAEYRQCG